MTNLPAHLQKQILPRIDDDATEGIGSAMPPHISIRGNEFTLIDAAGDKTTIETKHLDVAIIDMQKGMSKLYYGKDWEPGSNEPPLCWSSNGVGPSREAIEPQSPTCQQCPNNVRGSAVSKLSGASIKACRDEKWLALLIDGYEDMIFQFRITPGSFKNWSAFSEKFKKQPFSMRDVITRMAFEKDKNGVITFMPVGWLAPAMTELRNKLVLSKATDGIVGRLDQPITGTRIETSIANVAPHHTPLEPVRELPTTAAPEAPKKRGLKPKQAEPTPPNGGPAMAPFRPEAAPNFGIQEAASPPAEVANNLDAFFKS